MTSQHAIEIATGERFAFGDNWARFLRLLDEERVAQAERSLRAMLEVESLAGRRFVDIGSGSGLFSLAARRLGAIVHSFDFDPRSVACTAELRRRSRGDDPHWTIEMGSILDREYLARLGTFDLVYSWGVLHHTGKMREALDNAAELVAPGGQLFIAIYNDQGWRSRYWSTIKRQYNRSRVARAAIIVLHAPVLLGARWVVRACTGRLKDDRGMSLWHDMIDWLGGWPFEVARPEAILAAGRRHGLVLERLKTCGGKLGCNEFVFRRPPGADSVK